MESQRGTQGFQAPYTHPLALTERPVSLGREEGVSEALRET